jgi:hypothetical protein
MTEGIPFQLDQTTSNAMMAYRPWGTSTLKVQVSTESVMLPLRIRPKNVRTEEASAGLLRAFADEGSNFIISWGGGNEPGPCSKAEDFMMAFEKCVDLNPGDSSVIFFNVRHVGPEVPEVAMVTLQAYREADGKVVANLLVEMKRTAACQNDAVQFAETEPGKWRPFGNSLPTYDSRWWPRAVNYVAAGDLPLTIERSNNELCVQWQDKLSAVITDHTLPTILDLGDIAYELFYFDEWHVALRIWFFWLDKNIGKAFFVGRHEVPDAERFDMLIRRQDGATTLACTDLHWRETWGRVTRGEPLKATLGLSREAKIKLAEGAMSKMWRVWQRAEDVDHKRPYNPLPYIERMAATLGQEAVGTVRAKGTEAHLPALQNVESTDEDGRPPRMTSSDVRLG